MPASTRRTLVLLFLAVAALLGAARAAACPAAGGHHAVPVPCEQRAACAPAVAVAPVLDVVEAIVPATPRPASGEQRRPASVVLPVDVPPPRA